MFLLLLGWIISIATWNKFYIAFIQLIYLDTVFFFLEILASCWIQLCLWISIWRAKCIWRRILIQSMKANIWPKYSFISNFYYSKNVFITLDSLGDTSFVLLGSLSPLSKLPWKHGSISLCFWCQHQILSDCFSFSSRAKQRAAHALQLTIRDHVCFVGKLYWNSFGGIYQTQGRLGSPS